MTTIDGTKYVWHSGNQPGYSSALYVRAVEARRSFVVVANTDALNAGDDLRTSAAAKLFLS